MQGTAKIVFLNTTYQCKIKASLSPKYYTRDVDSSIKMQEETQFSKAIFNWVSSGGSSPDFLKSQNYYCISIDCTDLWLNGWPRSLRNPAASNSRLISARLLLLPFSFRTRSRAEEQRVIGGLRPWLHPSVHCHPVGSWLSAGTEGFAPSPTHSECVVLLLHYAP